MMASEQLTRCHNKYKAIKQYNSNNPSSESANEIRCLF